MKIILLPGLDGTGLFFTPLLSFLDKEKTQVISLPLSADQSYEALTDHVRSQLPKDDFILIAESFSGPIGVYLAKTQLTNLKAIVFVATFMSPPSKFLLKVFSNFPLQLIFTLPFSSFFLRRILLGNNASEDSLKYFRRVLLSVPRRVIRQRLQSIDTLKISAFRSNIPTYYIRATDDRLVPAKKLGEFQDTFKEIRLEAMKGPHFILQNCAEKCAELIRKIIQAQS